MPNSKTAPATPGKSAVHPPVTTKPATAPVANTTLAAALTMAQVVAMSQPDRVAFFRAKDEAAGRIFIDLGKLFTGIEAALGKGEQIFPLLMKAGVRKGSVSNASQTARVFKELVGGKVLAETVFDTFRWSDICALNRVMSGASHKTLTAAEAAKIVAANPKRFDEDLESIFSHGITVAEADKQLAANAAADKKRIADEAAAEQKRVTDAAVAAALVKQTAQNAANAASGASAPSVSAATTANATGAPGAPGAKSAPGAVAAGKITAMPAAYTAVDFDKDLQATMEKLGKAPLDQQKAAVPILEVYLATLKSGIAAAAAKAPAQPTVVAKPAGTTPAPAKAQPKKAA